MTFMTPRPLRPRRSPALRALLPTLTNASTRVPAAVLAAASAAAQRPPPPLPQLGSYRLQLTGSGAGGEAATLRLDTLAGALQLSGSGQWTGASLRFRGEARSAEAQAAALSNLLNIIGRRQGALSVISIG